jgi:hypothetical protein
MWRQGKCSLVFSDGRVHSAIYAHEELDTCVDCNENYHPDRTVSRTFIVNRHLFYKCLILNVSGLQAHNHVNPVNLLAHRNCGQAGDFQIAGRNIV